MSRQRHPGDREIAWRGHLIAAGAAAGVLLLLAMSVGLIWLVGRSSPSAPALGAQPAPTSTPRSLSFLHETPTPIAPEPPPTSGVDAEAQPSDATSPAVAPAPELTAVANDEQPGVLVDGAAFSAPDVHPFETLASGSWVAAEDALRNDGTTADAEPWLTLASLPEGPFAIEAEIRVNGLLDSFCNQSFGLVGGDADAAQVYGAGVLFPCEDGGRARLTDVSVWEDGYDADPAIAESAFDPGGDWRTYRLELRADTIRLIVDGIGVVAGTLDPALGATGGAEAGVWTQGVALEIRKIDVVPLPTS